MPAVEADQHAACGAQAPSRPRQSMMICTGQGQRRLCPVQKPSPQRARTFGTLSCGVVHFGGHRSATVTVEPSYDAADSFEVSDLWKDCSSVTGMIRRRSGGESEA